MDKTLDELEHEVHQACHMEKGIDRDVRIENALQALLHRIDKLKREQKAYDVYRIAQTALRGASILSDKGGRHEGR